MGEKLEKPKSKQILRRLPRYYRFLDRLIEDKVERISSAEFARMMNVTASQVRQDLSKFGGFGQQGYGYNVRLLHDEIGKILGIDKPHRLIVIGVGNLCRAIIHRRSFARYGFNFIGLFDISPQKIGQELYGIKIMPMSELEDFIDRNDVDIAVITVPHEGASELIERLNKTKIKGIWNFAHVDAEEVGDNIKVENVHLSDSLMYLSYHIENGED